MVSVAAKIPGVVLAGLAVLLSGASAWGQGANSSPVQTLDQVDIFDRNTVLDMDFYDRYPGVEFKNLGIAGTGLSDCKLFAEGLYCLEVNGAGQQVVRFWKDAQKPQEHVDLFRCDDSALGLTGSRPCTGLTVDLSRAVWVAGKKTAANYSLLKVSTAVCSLPGKVELTTDSPPPSAGLCAKEFKSGAGTLTDLNAVDGEVAARLPIAYGPGVLALLDSREALYFSLSGVGDDPVTFGSWNLAAGERLLSTTVLQVPVAPNDPNVTNYILATTSAGQTTTSRAQIRRKLVSGNPLVPSTSVDSVFDIASWEATHPGPASIRINASTWVNCVSPAGQTTCNLPGATLTTSGGSGFQQKSSSGATGLGIAGGLAGPEIDSNETLTVTFTTSQSVSAIEVLFLYNGPEFNDRAEKAQVTTNAGVYTLAVGNSLDDDGASWSGPGRVSKCGATTSAGSGCFRISNPFPGPVTSMAFTTSAGGTPFSGTGTNATDYSIGSIETAYYGLRTSAKTGRAYLADKDFSAVLALAPDDFGGLFTELDSVQVNQADLTLATSSVRPEGITVAPGIIFDLADCTVNCDLLKNSNGVPLLSLSAVNATGQTKSRLYEVRDVPDCRFVPQVCTDLLGSPGLDHAGAVAMLIADGVIVPLAGIGSPWYSSPAAQLLNVSPLLPEDIQSLFDGTTTPPGGLPPLLISKWYRGQASTNDYRFNGFFFRSDQGVVFTDTYFGEIDVLALTGQSLGCFPPTAANATIADRLQWDLITTVSEDVKSVGGDYIDTLTNVGCRNPTKIAGGRTSFFPYNLEVASDTYGPTVRSSTPSVTLKNDGVFARLLQSLYADLRSTLDTYTCQPSSTPLTKAKCDLLRKYWASGKQKLDKCVDAAFQPKASASNENCQSFRNQLASYKVALPATASGADPDNRLGEQKWRWEVISHVFETRFLPSIPSNGYCRERTAPNYAGCDSPIVP